LAAEEIQNGAKGVVFGRNAIQVKDPFSFQNALCDVEKKKGKSPGDALSEYGLIDRHKKI